MVTHFRRQCLNNNHKENTHESNVTKEYVDGENDQGKPVDEREIVSFCEIDVYTEGSQAKTRAHRRDQ